jgi:fatty-acyl-CoA synthase
MSDDLLRNPTHNGHLLVGALKRHKTKPVLFLGDTTLTGGQMAERISQYIQAFEALGAGTGVAVGLLSLNRPEVLLIIGAGQTRGYRRTALHPLGSLDDHAYVLNDAGISSLIIDPNPMFVERALALLKKVPGLKQILTIGPVPEALSGAAVDLAAEAAKYDPQPLTAADRGHHLQDQGRDGHRAVDLLHDPDPALGVGVAPGPAVLDDHPAVTRRGGVFPAHPDQGRRDARAAQVRSR